MLCDIYRYGWLCFITTRALTLNIVMTKHVNSYLFSAYFCRTYGTINYIIVRSCNCTSRSYIVLYNKFRICMTKCGNNFLRKSGFTTYRTLLTFSKTGFGTSSVLACYGFFLVTKSINFILSYKSIATYRTILTLGKTGLSASSILTCYGLFLVTKSINCYALSGKLYVTCRTVNNLIIRTRCLTSRSNVVLYNFTFGVSAYCVNAVVANRMIAISKLVCIITVIGVICRVKVYECTAGNNELTSVISFIFVDIKNVPIAIVAFSRLKVTALNANDTAGFAEDNVTVRSGVVVTALDSKHRVNTAGDNRICTCSVLTAAYYVTITNNCEMRSIVNVDNLNNTVGFPVSLKCLTVKIECNDSTLNINGFGKVDVSIKKYVEAVCKKVYKITFVCNGKCICCINKHLFGQASANGNVVEIIAVSPVFNLGCVTGCRNNFLFYLIVTYCAVLTCSET